MYDLFLSKRAQRFMRKSDKNLRGRIWEKLDGLKKNPFPQDIKRVEGEKGTVFRIRVGEHRVNFAYAEVFPGHVDKKKEGTWNYLCRKHYYLEQKRFKGKLPACFTVEW